MDNNSFDFGAMLDAQFGGIRKGYKFGKAFNEDKSLVRPEKKTLVVDSNDNAAIKTAFEQGEAIAGVVDKETKGGYEVTIAGQRAFCPFSQIDKFKKDAAEYVGRKFEFLVTDYSVDDRGLNVVVSRRQLLELQAEALKEAVLNELTEGETLNGTVTRVMNFGAFVDLGGVEGLVPAREVAWERVDDLNTLIKSGDAITGEDPARRPRGGQGDAFAQGVHGANVQAYARGRGGREVRRGGRRVDEGQREEERGLRDGSV